MRLDSIVRTAVAAGRAAPELKKLQGAAGELEASFVKQMLAEMRKATPETSMGEKYGGDMFRDMFDDALAKQMTGQFGLGIARQVTKSAAPEVVRQELSEMIREAQAKLPKTTISIK